MDYYHFPYRTGIARFETKRGEMSGLVANNVRSIMLEAMVRRWVKACAGHEKICMPVLTI